ncbi:putative ABC transport system ATP-binding protein [Roseimicrobium gellanilyticum]|uniref:Putative ABC transport system ATP-binding protein n=1 Tax=Roseimicrobium gellanilyticum TaxID=748857 RepID=A0A366HV84_9BACT|nr:ABC transporter ATP-binding protein [Roseimicrobium gellanilyticum]RBP48201.1 putative ABC transport system ATP-binding protein [Roseimicrobium gellanilyticum]
MTKESGNPLRVECVVKTFSQGAKKVTALDGVSLEVNKGEFLAIMGASGSGKSTLLHVMAGLTDVDAGSVSVEGQNLAGMSDSALTRFRRAKIGMVFQAFNLLPSLSAEQNVQLPALELPDAAARAERVMQRLGILDRRMHRPDAMSGGEQQRVAIARALIMNPAILLADEPTGSLDSRTGQELCRLLQTLCCEEGRTIILVTHEPRVAMWADRVLVFKDGKTLSQFTPKSGGSAEDVALAYEHALEVGA